MPTGRRSDDERDDVAALRERAKELRCVYEVSAALARRDDPVTDVFAGVLAALPPAWQFPDDTTARIEYLGRTHPGEGFVDTPWRLRSSITIWRTVVGAVEVHYRSPQPLAWEGPFLREERVLLDNVAQRLGEYLEWKQRELGGERLGASPEHWRWRQRLAERMALLMDRDRFGVRDVFLYGSTEAGTAGPGSDIDLLVACDGDDARRHDLEVWLDGWSRCLAELTYQMIGLPVAGMIGARIVGAEEAAASVRAAALAGRPMRRLPGAG
jgi:hypothetical protein